MTNLGTSSKPLALTGEQDVIEVRTSDPSNPDADERWIREDVAPETNQIATMRCGDGTEIPIFSTGTATDTVRECRRVRVNGQTGYLPVAPLSDASFDERRIQHAGQTMAYHDAVSPGPAIPDAEDLHARYDATELSLNDGDAVTTWGDETGNGFDLTTTTSPTYRTNQQNGLPAVDIDISDDLTVDWTDPTAPYHLFLVFRYVGSNSNNAFIVSGGSGGESDFITDTDDRSFAARINGTEYDTGTVSDNNWHIASISLDSSHEFRLDGSQINSASVTVPTQTGLTLGKYAGSISDSQFYAGVEFGEILFYDADKTSKVTDVESYLNDKWAVY